MKLRNRLALLMITFMLVAVLIVTAFMIFSFSESFKLFLSYTEDQRIQKIATDISEQVIIDGKISDKKSWDSRLKIYSEDSKINITIMDNDSKIVAGYKGLKYNPHRDIKTESYILVNENRENIGSLLITHDLNNPAYEELKKEFQANTLGSLPLLFPIFLIAAFFLAGKFSARLTRPIEDLSSKIQSLSHGVYDDIEVNSDLAEIKTLAGSFSYLSATLKDQEEVRKAYGQDISHDLRTPLTNISLQLEAMEDGVVPIDSEALKVIRNNCDQLTDIVKRLRESYDLTSMEVSSMMHEVNISQFTEKILDAFEPGIKEKKLVLVRAIDPMIFMDTDERLYSEMLNNLLSNALKAVDVGGRIRVALNQNKKYIMLSVTDNGIGIKKEDQKHIFDRFYRVDSSRNKALGGSGLGLAITKNIVKQLGGEISLSSKVGRGTVFRIYFKSPAHEKLNV